MIIVILNNKTVIRRYIVSQKNICIDNKAYVYIYYFIQDF